MQIQNNLNYYINITIYKKHSNYGLYKICWFRYIQMSLFKNIKIKI